MGDGLLIISFVVVVIGGLGSVSGAFWSALLIGLVDTLGKAYAPKLAGLAVYMLMAAVLLWRPSGLFGAQRHHCTGRAPRVACCRAAGRAGSGWHSRPRCWRRCRFSRRPTMSELATTAMIAAMLALSLHLLVG